MNRKNLLVGAAVAIIAGGSVLLGTHKDTSQGSTILIANDTDVPAMVFVSFGADSVVKAADWSAFCSVSAPLNCSFQMAAHSTQPASINGKYLNTTISYNGQGCGTTKAELNVNNPNWFSVLDVSLVDGFSNKVMITNLHGMEKTTLGPPVGQYGNEKLLGVYPYGCDICVARQNPPCGITSGGSGCKAGEQYNPDPPCQWQSPYGKGTMDNSSITVTLVK